MNRRIWLVLLNSFLDSSRYIPNAFVINGKDQADYVRAQTAASAEVVSQISFSKMKILSCCIIGMLSFQLMVSGIR